ncbi:WD40 repeat domain-containing protein [Vairimorpha necatrix]|uniref:WD40 repeat domain-containing protein n=1 Tax=Vairimorpha necatrix TaxID=6039 RepID=A0AAX4JAQ2_9MICR
MSTIENNDIREVSDFIFPEFKVHDEGVVTQHWQLKDMLKIHNGNLIFPQSNKVYSYDPKTRTKLLLSEDLSFPPASLCVEEDFLAIGGGKGQLYVKNLINNETKYYFLSDNINNHISIHDKKIYASNNDRKLRILSVENDSVQTIDFISQINHTSVSPDGKYLIMVGDSNDVFLYVIENSNYRFLKKLKTINDSGFSVAWNNFSNKFAVASQDGFVSVWDLRSDEKSYILRSKQQGTHKGAVRNVFFSIKKSLDLIFFTEQSSYLSIFDARSFEKRQLVNLGDDVQITGATISEEDFKIFVSSEHKIYEYDINTISRRIFDTK